MADFDRSILTRVAHRPWPMAAGPWALTQTWTDLLFAHWPVEAASMRRRIPPELDLDLFDGRAWIGVVPFRMSNVTPRLVPPLPWVSTFPELNVRTYVRAGDKPGVFFFSLDAGSALAVAAAQALLNLPYFHADMTIESGTEIHYSSRRKGSPAADFEARYRPAGSPRVAAAGSLEHFLTERYCLYAVDRARRPYRLEIHHPAWTLESADAEIAVNTMARAAGIDLPDVAPLLHFAARQDTVCWLPERL